MIQVFAGYAVVRACDLTVYSCFSDASSLFDKTQWDGSDIFLIWPLPRYIFVSDRVRQLIIDGGLRGAVLVPPDELQCKSGTLTPGSLGDWFQTPPGAGLEDRYEIR